MPAVPEVRYGPCKIRALKIGVQGYAKALRGAHDYIHAAREIAVELKGIAQYAGYQQDAVIGLVIAEYFTDNHSGPVRYDDFLEIAPEHELKSPLYPGEAEAFLPVEL